jgi:hypothetical protein
VSDYQYYEFLALDRPLTSKQREELRQLSTRAEITATRFTNEYHWGSPVPAARHFRSAQPATVRGSRGSVFCTTPRGDADAPGRQS